MGEKLFNFETPFWSKAIIIKIVEKNREATLQTKQEGWGHYAVYYTSPQSFIVMFSYSMV